MNDRVLILDDSLTVRMDLVEAFRGAGFDPVPCGTVAEAREKVAERPVALAVLDVILPDGNGIELLADLRAAPRTADLPVLILSSETEVRDRARGLSSGANEYVGKPYESSYVVARARELVRRDATSAAARAQVVLIVDDSLTFREALRRALEEGGYRVVTAENGEEGLRLAAAERPHAAIIDGQLPGADGTTIIRRIRLDGALRRMPCLLLTASRDEADEVRALDAGADAFVRKDEEVETILARLGAVLRTVGVGREESDATSLMGPKRILAVDDHPAALEQLARLLRGEGYELVTARSGEEALELLALQPMDCILLDWHMPGLGGPATCRRIKAAPAIRNTPLVMLAGPDDRHVVIEALGAGADDVIVGTDPATVKARLVAQLRRRQLEDERRRIHDHALRMEVEATETRAAKEIATARALMVEELERKHRELEAFSYSVSHDLRAPLRGIEGFSRALLEDYGAGLEPRARDHLDRVLQSTQRMGELIEDLLRLARIGRAEIRRQRVDLSTLARAVISELAARNPERSVEVQIADGIVADADPRLIRVVLENVLGNAWKFTAKTPHPRIELEASDDDAVQMFVVRDNGAGFDMDHARRLFAPFVRLHNESDFPGTGVGLATVQRIIDRHGGRIWAEGSVGRGASIRWTLPRLR